MVIVGKVMVTEHTSLYAGMQAVTSGNTTLMRLDVTAADDCHELEVLKRRRD